MVILRKGKYEMLDITKKNVTENEGLYLLKNGAEIFAKTITARNGNEKRAIFIHGGGSGGNHTIVYRPSFWLLNQGLFSSVIMPDRRGAGHSSPLEAPMSYDENAQDMKQLLDCIGLEGKITAIGISYGGPIALSLAAIDERVDEVILVASSPSLRPAKGFVGYLYRKGLLEKLVNYVYSKNIGKLDPRYPDFDGAYQSRSVSALKKLFFNAIQCTKKERLQSLIFENKSTCDRKNAAISTRHKINVPVLRIIGTKDETWEVDLNGRYDSQISKMESIYVQNASHKDIFFQASRFYETLAAHMNNRA
jgi:pimeloyl-ACP methyl ester carboxylesterase